MATRTLKITIGKMDGSTTLVSIPNAAQASDITVSKLNAFVDSYDEVLGGNQLSNLTKAIITSSEDQLIYPID